MTLVASCPLCSYTLPTLIRSIEAGRLIVTWWQQWAIDIAGELAGVAQIDLWECGRCHLQFFMPDRSVGTPQLYSQLEKFDWYYMPCKWEHDVALDDLRGCQTLLEIGCGFGDFVARAREVGVQAEGIDLNDSAVRMAQQRGLPVQRLDLREAADRYPVHYDVVCSFQVLEHVPNPGDFLRWSCALVKPGGKLLLGVPNADSFLKHEFNLLDMPPHHMTRWPPRLMDYVPQLFPLRLEHIRREPLAKYHVDGYIAAQCAAMFGHGVLNRSYMRVIAPRLSTLLKRSGLRQHLIGQTLYAAFTRL